MIIKVFSNSMNFPCMELFWGIFQVFQKACGNPACKTALKLNQLSRMAVQDFVGDGTLHPSQILSETPNSVLQMPNITVSLNGVFKLLNPLKAAGPDNLKP